jgi:hypothetical protein
VVYGGGRSTDAAGYPMSRDRRVVALAAEAEGAGEVAKAGGSAGAFRPGAEVMKNPTGGVKAKRDLAELTEGGVDLVRGDGAQRLVFGAAFAAFGDDADGGVCPFD